MLFLVFLGLLPRNKVPERCRKVREGVSLISSKFRPNPTEWRRVMVKMLIEGHKYYSHDYLHVSVVAVAVVAEIAAVAPVAPVVV